MQPSKSFAATLAFRTKFVPNRSPWQFLFSFKLKYEELMEATLLYRFTNAVVPTKIYIVLYRGPPLWSSGQSPWLQIQSSEFDSRFPVWNGVHSAPWVQLRSYLEEKVAAPV
jgi:hypothetical protein